jgi:hypothetical protein
MIQKYNKSIIRHASVLYRKIIIIRYLLDFNNNIISFLTADYRKFLC